MTYKERIEMALKNSDMEEGRLDSLLTFAYHMGKEDGVKEVADKADKRWNEIVKRAKESRYHEMAKRIIGYDAHGNKYINDMFTYNPDYAGDFTSAFGSDKWNEDGKDNKYITANFTVYFEDGTLWDGVGEYTLEDLQHIKDADFRDACQMVVEEPWTEEELDSIKSIQMNLETGEEICM